jgi:diacylglycerol kinase family enzyme
VCVCVCAGSRKNGELHHPLIARSADLDVSNTIVICGGDGLVSEVITGLMNRGADIKDKVD